MIIACHLWLNFVDFLFFNFSNLSSSLTINLAQNQNVQAIVQAEKERRDKLKAEADNKKAQDKVNREKQKQKQDERREKERKRTQKREHKRWVWDSIVTLKFVNGK